MNKNNARELGQLVVDAYVNDERYKAWGVSRYSKPDDDGEEVIHDPPSHQTVFFRGKEKWYGKPRIKCSQEKTLDVRKQVCPKTPQMG